MPKSYPLVSFSLTKWLIENFSGKAGTNLPTRILNLFCLVTCVSFLNFVLISALVFDRLGHCQQHIAWAFLSGFSFWLSYSLNYSKAAFVIMLIVGYSCMTDSWVHEGGYFGPFLLMFMVFVVYYCFMLPHKWQTLFIIINLCYAFSLGFVFPCYDVIESHDFSVFRLLLALCCCVIAIYFCASVLDYSYKKERKLALSRQQSLEEVAELQTQMLSIISHDVRAPLANVELLLTMINKGMLTQAQQADMMVKLQKSVHQSREVLESMVGWTRSQVVNTQQKTAIIVRCDVARIIEENIPDWQDFAISKGLTLDYVPAPKQAATTTIADANLVRTATRNLIMNAIKFTPEGGTITLTVAVAEPDLIISVIDTGIGIAPDRLSQLFGQRITSKVGTNGEKGSGIGLWIVNDMIKKVGGSILVTSELGKGSTFSLQMPQ